MTTTESQKDLFWDSNYNIPQQVFNMQEYHWKRLSEILLNQFINGGTGVEVGCGGGQYIHFLTKVCDLKMNGVEKSKQGYDACFKLCKSTGIATAGISNKDLFDFHGKYDYAFSMGVVEHFEDKTEVIKKIASLVKKDGLIITSVPNFDSLITRFKMLFLKEFKAIHYRTTKEEIEGIYKSLGIKTIQSSYFNLSLPRCLFTKIPTSFKILENKWFASGFIVIGQL